MDIPLNQPHPDPREQARIDRRRFVRAVLWSSGFVVLLWWILLVEQISGLSFSGLGVRPRTLAGLIGILAAPLLHASPGHLINNSFPLLVLGVLGFSIYPRSMPRAVALIWIGSGVGIWLFGRDSVHLGASGVAHGLMFFLFWLGLLRRDRPAVATAMIAFFLYGGMVLSIFPGDPQISWEAHMFGAFFGLLAAIFWFRRDPPPARKRYSWEEEDDEEPLEDRFAARERALYEPPAPQDVPVLWQRAEPPAPDSGKVIPFPGPQKKTPPEA